MRRKCLNVACTEHYTPTRENRPFHPCCSSECLQAYRAAYDAAQPQLALATPPSVPMQRRVVNRKHAKQNWKGSE